MQVKHESNLDIVPQLQSGVGLWQQKELTHLTWWGPTSVTWYHN